METFYVLEFTHPAPEVIDVRYKYVKCSMCGARPVARVGGTGVRFTKKSELVDFSRTAQGIIVRRSVIEHLTEARMSGWRQGYLRVDTVSKLREQDTEYYELVVIGHTREYAAHVGLEIERECEECGRRTFVYPHEGLILPEECWDGSDIFVIEELAIYLTTWDFRQTVDKYQHTGIEFVPIAEWRDPLGWLRKI